MFRNERFESRSRLQVAIWWIMQSCVQICPYRWAAELASRRNTEAENVDQLVYGLECVEKGSEKNLLPRHAGAAEGCWVPGCRAGTDVASGRERCSARKRPHLQAVALQRRSGGSRQSLAEPAGAPLRFIFYRGAMLLHRARAQPHSPCPRPPRCVRRAPSARGWFARDVYAGAHQPIFISGRFLWFFMLRFQPSKGHSRHAFAVRADRASVPINRGVPHKQYRAGFA